MHAENDKVLKMLKNIKTSFPKPYDNPSLRGGPRFSYIINSVKRRLGWIKSISYFFEITRIINGSISKQVLNGQSLDMDML
jgi:hypothetical protein